MNANLDDLALFVGFCFATSIVPLGIILNFVCIVVFLQKRLNQKKSSIGLLHALLCLSNIFGLLNSMLFTHFLPFFNIVVVNSSVLACKLLNIWSRVTLQYPSWIQLLISMHMFISVCYPNKFMLIKRRRVLFILIGIIAIVLMLANIEYVFYEMRASRRSNNNTNSDPKNLRARCRAPNRNFHFFSNMINIIMRNFLPFVLMLLINIVTLNRLKNSRRKTLHKQKHFTSVNFIISTIGLNFIFVIVNAPWSVAYVLENAYDNDLLLADWFSLFENVAISISFLNNLSPFIANICLNRLFRSELLYIGQRLLNKCRTRNRISSEVKQSNKPIRT
jgi:hypothetical protein